MVTVDEEIARALAEADQHDHDPVEWYAICICQAFRSQDEDVDELIEAIEEHWPDFEEADNPHRLASKKHGYR